MPKAPYRIIYFLSAEETPCPSWEFHDAEFETAEAAYEVALEKYTYNPFRVVKICYPKED